MYLAITVKAGSDLDEIRELIAALRTRLRDHLTILEAPPGFESPYPFPLLTLEEGQIHERVFGQDAVARMRDIVRQAA